MTPKNAFFAGWTAHANVALTGANLTAAELWDEICARHSPKPAKSARGGWGAFAAALKRVLPAAEVRSTIPILECVLLQSSAGILTLTCTDMDSALSERIEAPGLADMEVAVPAKLLFNVIKNLPPGGVIAFEAPGEKHGGIFNIGGSSLATRDPDDFPRITAPAWQQSFSLPADVILRALNAVKHGISTEETRYYLNGVHILIQDGTLTFVTSDGHRLFLKSIALPPGIAELPHIIVPRATIAILLPLLAKRCDVVRIDLTETRMCFSFGPVELTIKLIDGTFPAFNRVIPRDNSLKVTFDAAKLSDAAQAVKQVSKDRSKPVNIDLGPDYCTVSARDPECGMSVREVAPLETPCFTAEIGLQARYLIDTLSCVAGPVEIAFAEQSKTPGVCDPSAPVLLTMPGDDSWLSVIMPMRI